MHHLRFQIVRPIGAECVEVGEAQCVVCTEDTYDAIGAVARRLEADGWQITHVPEISMLAEDIEQPPLVEMLIRSAKSGGVAYDTETNELPSGDTSDGSIEKR